MSYDNIDVKKLLQPNLLTEQELISILKERCVKVEKMGAMSKEQLLNIFNRVVTPLEQRPGRKSLNNDIYNNHPKQVNNRSTYSITDEDINLKRIKLDDVPSEVCAANAKVALKRKNSMDTSNDIPSLKKSRQRICWP